MRELSKHLKYTFNDNVEIVELDNEWILLDTQNFKITKINKMGAYVLETLRENKDMDDILERVTADFDVEVTIARSDVYAFLEEIKKIGAIKYATELSNI